MNSKNKMFGILVINNSELVKKNVVLKLSIKECMFLNQ